MRISFLAVLSILVLSTAKAFSADNSAYGDGVLTLPSVDTASQVGQYQNVIFRLSPEGTWTLADLQVVGSGSIYQVSVIENVEIVKTDTPPVNVYLRVSGVERSCDITGPAQFHQRRQGTHFDVIFSAPHSRPPTSGAIVCTANVSSFKQTVALQVLGLSAGTYTYSLNGISGTFTLDRDNKFQDECDVIFGGGCPLP